MWFIGKADHFLAAHLKEKAAEAASASLAVSISLDSLMAAAQQEGGDRRRRWGE